VSCSIGRLIKRFGGSRTRFGACAHALAALSCLCLLCHLSLPRCACPRASAALLSAQTGRRALSVASGERQITAWLWRGDAALRRVSRSKHGRDNWRQGKWRRRRRSRWHHAGVNLPHLVYYRVCLASSARCRRGIFAFFLFSSCRIVTALFASNICFNRAFACCRLCRRCARRRS